MKRQILLDQNLKELIAEKGTTQVSLAKKVSMNNSTLHGYINGVVPSGIIGLIRIAEIYEISLDELFFKEQLTEATNDVDLALFLKKYELTLSIKDKLTST